MAEQKHVVRRLYDWMLAWADSPHAGRALFLLAFAESSVFPIPPDPLLITLALGRRDKALTYAFLCSLGSVLGGLFGYLIGATLWEGVDGFFYDWIPGFTPAGFEAFAAHYEQHGFLIVFVAGFTPVPYKVITIASGALNLNVLVFTFASLVSRSARFYLLAFLVRQFGPPIRIFIDRWFDRLALALLVLGVGGFVALKLLF